MPSVTLSLHFLTEGVKLLEASWSDFERRKLFPKINTKGSPDTQNQRIRPPFNGRKCRSRSPESFGPVLAPKLAPRPPTKPAGTNTHTDRQTDRHTDTQTDAEPRISPCTATPRPPSTHVKEIDIPFGGQTVCPPNGMSISCGLPQTAFPPLIRIYLILRGAIIGTAVGALFPAVAHSAPLTGGVMGGFLGMSLTGDKMKVAIHATTHTLLIRRP